MVDVGGMLTKVAAEGGLISLIYKDLARPGVKQVGKALKTVLELGNSLLLPIRLVNETSAQFEKRKFEEIADRFEKIPDNEIVEVSPEIGVPILEHLSHTEDKTLREMFVELLGKAATQSQVSKAHPSFVSVVASISPDEAILIQHLMNFVLHPIMTIDLREASGMGQTNLVDLVIVPPNGLAYPDNIPLYLSNLSGLGILEIRRGTQLTAPTAYNATEAYAKKKFGLPAVIKSDAGNKQVIYNKHVLAFLPYGKAFAEACSA